VNCDDEVVVLISSTRRYCSGIQQQHPPPSSSQQPPMLLLLKSPMDSMLHHAAITEVSVLGFPPALSMPFSGNEDTGYIVSVPVPGLISNSPNHRGPIIHTVRVFEGKQSSGVDDAFQAYHGDQVERRIGEDFE